MCGPKLAPGSEATILARVRGLPSFTTVCRNCGSTLHGEFCSACGQGHRHERLRIRDWIGDVVDGVVSLESRTAQTVLGLTLRPGQVARDYVDGGRVRYVSPARYALATCALWWLAVALNPGSSTAAPTIWWVKYGEFVNLATIPLLVPAVQLAFIGSRYNYAEYLGFLLLTTGQLFLGRAAFAAFAAFALSTVVASRSATIAVGAIDQLLSIAYLSWALWGFHRREVRWLPARIVAAMLGMVIVSSLVGVAGAFLSTRVN